MKQKPNKLKAEGFELIPESVGIILDSIWVNKEKNEIIIKSAFGGQWHWKPIWYENNKKKYSGGIARFSELFEI